MALTLQYFNLIHRFKSLNGYQYLVEQYPSRFLMNVWYDRDIIRDGGAMEYEDIEVYLESLSKNGLSITRTIENRIEWEDVCVVATGIGICNYDCPWLIFDEKTDTVYIEDGEKTLYGPNSPSLVHNPNLCVISGKLIGQDNIFAGSVRLDDFYFGHNCNGRGDFAIYLPPGSHEKLNQESDIHTIEFNNYITGKISKKEFKLTRSHRIEINE